jgi:hypothetical protein
MTNPNAERSSYTHLGLKGFVGGVVVLFALNSSGSAEVEPAAQPMAVASVDAYDFPEKSELETTVEISRTTDKIGRSAVRTEPDIYCWDGEKEFAIASAKDQKHKNIGSACVLATKEDWYKDNPETEVKCLVKLWTRESQFNHKADNKYSSAFGIPQALPGSKMASAGKDWRTNPKTQIKWGLGYIDGRYETPCEAWEHSERKGWY